MVQLRSASSSSFFARKMMILLLLRKRDVSAHLSRQAGRQGQGKQCVVAPPSVRPVIFFSFAEPAHENIRRVSFAFFFFAFRMNEEECTYYVYMEAERANRPPGGSLAVIETPWRVQHERTHPHHVPNARFPRRVSHDTD
jgi:hypothetical protein